VGLLGALVCGVVLAAHTYRCWRFSSGLPCHLYLAWFVSAGAVLVLLRPWDIRYLFHLWPALLVLVLGSVPALPRRWGLVLGSIFVVSFALSAMPPRLPPNLYGHEHAARHALSTAPKRILYCGPNPGSFVYAVRKTQDWPTPAVIRADQLQEGVSSSLPGLQTFAWEYAVDSIVIETGTTCPDLDPEQWPALRPLGTVTLAGTHIENARIIVFQNRSVSPAPKTRLSLDSKLIPGGIEVDYNP
jgi:hypothetical protein